jgi:hypothetical protein
MEFNVLYYDHFGIEEASRNTGNRLLEMYRKIEIELGLEDNQSDIPTA